LQKFVPDCKFYGADPILESGKIFKTIGPYYQTAISHVPGEFNASVLIKNVYVWQKVKAITLVDFLKNKLNLKAVDYLFMDIEGPEYEILPQFMSDGPIEEYGPICSINVELHGPLESYGVNDTIFASVIRQLFNNSRYIPIWIPPPARHHRMALIDWKSEYCVNKFYKDWYC